MTAKERNAFIVIPANAGIQYLSIVLDPRLRGDDGKGAQCFHRHSRECGNPVAATLPAFLIYAGMMATWVSTGLAKGTGRTAQHQ